MALGYVSLRKNEKSDEKSLKFEIVKIYKWNSRVPEGE